MNGKGATDSGPSSGQLQAKMELMSGFQIRKPEAWWHFTEGRSPASA